jgi:3-deoxy-D-manno-octulosonate 8-phosphate phosphatase (KDO 8-P phosphatase)
MNRKEIEKIVEEKTKVLILDADGTFFDGYETRAIMPDNKVTIYKRRYFPDGQGLSFVRALGIRVLFVSGEGEPLESNIEKLNNLPSVKNGSWSKIEMYSKKSGQGKVEAINEWLTKNDFDWNNCLYVGDDINDYKAMLKVKSGGGIVIAPNNATRKIKEVAHFVTEKAGGRGAIREISEIILDAKGVDESVLPPS